MGQSALILLGSVLTAVCDFLMRIGLQPASRGDGGYGRVTPPHPFTRTRYV